MNKTGRTIAKNAGVMMASQVITWVFALLLTLFLPRYLGPEGVGKYQLAVSIWAVVSILLAFGMDVLQTKEISRHPERSNELLTTTVVLRVGLYMVCLIIVNIFVRVVHYPQETVDVVNIVGISTLVWQISSALGANLMAYERMEFISLSDILAKSFVTIVSIAALVMGYSVFAIAWINMFAGLIAIGVQIYGLRRIHEIKLVLKKDLFVWILKSSVPYMLVSGFLIAYNQIDVIIISLLVSETEVGWYSASNRLFGTFLFFPTVLIAAVFPVFSRLHENDAEKLKELLNRSFNIFLLVGIPIGLGLFALGSPLVILLFGEEFAPGGTILSIMGLVMITTYLNTLMGKFFISIDRQKTWTWFMFLAVAVTIPLDLLLVPICEKLFGVGALGGAISYLVTETGMMIAGLIFMPKGLLNSTSARFAFKALLSGGLMSLGVWLLRDTFIAIPILAGALLYAAAIWGLKVLSAEEIDLLKDIVAKVALKVRKPKPQPANIIE